MPKPELNIVVCVDRRRCMHKRSNGRNGPELLAALKSTVEEHALKERVQVKPIVSAYLAVPMGPGLTWPRGGLAKRPCTGIWTGT